VRAYKPRLFLVTPTHGTARDRPAVEQRPVFGAAGFAVSKTGLCSTAPEGAIARGAGGDASQLSRT